MKILYFQCILKTTNTVLEICIKFKCIHTARIHAQAQLEVCSAKLLLHLEMLTSLYKFLTTSKIKELIQEFIPIIQEIAQLLKAVM